MDTLTGSGQSDDGLENDPAALGGIEMWGLARAKAC